MLDLMKEGGLADRAIAVTRDDLAERAREKQLAEAIHRPDDNSALASIQELGCIIMAIVRSGDE